MVYRVSEQPSGMPSMSASPATGCRILKIVHKLLYHKGLHISSTMSRRHIASDGRIVRAVRDQHATGQVVAAPESRQAVRAWLTVACPRRYPKSSSRCAAQAAPAAERFHRAVVDVRTRTRVPSQRRRPLRPPPEIWQALKAVVAVRVGDAAPFANVRVDPAVTMSLLQRAARTEPQSHTSMPPALPLRVVARSRYGAASWCRLVIRSCVFRHHHHVGGVGPTDNGRGPRAGDDAERGSDERRRQMICRRRCRAQR